MGDLRFLLPLNPWGDRFSLTVSSVFKLQFKRKEENVSLAVAIKKLNRLTII